MKQSWALLAGPAVGTVASAALCAALAPEMATGPIRGLQVVSFGLAAWASGLTAFRFGAGDYLRRAWLLFTACYALLLLDVIAFGSATLLSPRHLSTEQATISGVITLLANLAAVVGLVLVARAWRVAGLPLGVSRASFLVLELALAAVALALLGPSAWKMLQEMVGGKPDAAHELVSTLGDVASLLLLGPLLLTARAMRGGLLGWTWGLIGASTLAWLVVDGVESLGGALGLSAVITVSLSEVLRVLASLFQVSAAIAQRRAIAR